jgi:ribosomal protein L37E
VAILIPKVFIHKLLTEFLVRGMNNIDGKAEMTSEEIINILKDKKATLPCPACGQDAFTLLDGDFTQEFLPWRSPSFAPLGLRGQRSFHYIVLVCDNCGYLRQHAMKPLGITPKYRRG